MIHVGKYLFWNTVLSTFFLLLSSPFSFEPLGTFTDYQNILVDTYVRKFFMTGILMIIIFISLLFKIVLGLTYLISYRCSHSAKVSHSYGDNPNTDSAITTYFNEIKVSILADVEKHVYDLVNHVKNNDK